MCLAAIGTQTGGSIVRPASFCGVCGLKPSHGTINLDGVAPVSALLDHAGPIARTVDDLVLLLIALSGAKVNSLPIASLRPRFLQAEPAYWFHASQEVRDTLAEVLDERLLNQAPSIALPASFAEVHVMHRRIMAYDAARVHAQAFAQQSAGFGPQVAGLIEEGLRVSDNQYQAALDHRRKFIADMRSLLSVCDGLITPATVTTAPGLETTGDPWFNSPWSYAGLPAVSVSCGIAADGLPVAVQLIGHPQRLEALLNGARWVESLFVPLPEPPLLQELDLK
jgi:aspartyl-tRNA(Asn)/glutamyl-tRNA(Gln) amidotransferase subunit A